MPPLCPSCSKSTVETSTAFTSCLCTSWGHFCCCLAGTDYLFICLIYTPPFLSVRLHPKLRRCRDHMTDISKAVTRSPYIATQRLGGFGGWHLVVTTTHEEGAEFLSQRLDCVALVFLQPVPYVWVCIHVKVGATLHIHSSDAPVMELPVQKGPLAILLSCS